MVIQILIVVLLLGALSPAAAAATTIQAVSCERAVVGAAHDKARDGDTIVIPAGTCTWTKTLVVTKTLTIQGAGIDQTTLIQAVPWTDGAVSPYQTQLVILDTKPGGITRLTGMTLDGGTGDVDPKKRGMLTISGKSKTWRIDSIRFKITRTWGLVFNMDGYGVIDHNRFEVTGWGLTGITGLHSSWGGKSYGDGSWAAPTNLGSGEAVYVEDNLFQGPTTAITVAHGGYGGERIVWRYNRMENTVYGNHGTESTQRMRGARVCEIYKNTAVWTQPYHFVFGGLRSCVGVIFSNTITGPADRVATLKNFRSEQAYKPWGKCDGTSPWDGNQGPQPGYPCLDQPGRGQSVLISGSPPTPTGWPNQKLEPIHAWDNTLNGAAGKLFSEQDVIVEGRDFFNTPATGYTPYVYPHPLVTARCRVRGDRQAVHDQRREGCPRARQARR